MDSIEFFKTSGFIYKPKVAPSGLVSEIICNGFYNYYYNLGQINCDICTIEEIKKDINNYTNDSMITNNIIKSKIVKPLYDVLSGLSFLKSVKEKYISNNDGTVIDIFVDGYISNIGLKTNYYSCGNFMLGEQDWKDFCKKHKVLVNFAHK